MKSRAQGLANDWVMQVLQRNADKPDVLENARAAFLAGMRAVLEEAERARIAGTLYFGNAGKQSVWLEIEALRALFEPQTEGQG